MKVLSISDVITNSSSEVFLLTSPYKAKDLKDTLLKIHKDGYGENVDRCSGMGGIFDIGDWTVFYISQATGLWLIRKGMLGDWSERINDPEDDLTWEDVSKYYEKYPNLDKKEFSYTVKDWLKEYNISNVAFGANFYPYIDKGTKLPISTYPQEAYSKNILLDNGKVTITPSSFNLNPIKVIEV